MAEVALIPAAGRVSRGIPERSVLRDAPAGDAPPLPPPVTVPVIVPVIVIGTGTGR